MRVTMAAMGDGQRFLTKTQHYRKVTKPLLERKRRARMNLYLDELKDLVVDFMEAEGEHVAKLEKADILEMTVNFLKMQKHEGRQRGMVHAGQQPLQQQQPLGGVLHMEKFRDGYTQAAYDVSKLFSTLPGLDLKFGTRLMQHLGCRLKDIKSSATEAKSPPSSASTPMMAASPIPSAFHHHHQPRIISQMDLRNIEGEELQAKHEDVWRPW